jgi:excinuclease ABC subunit C
MIQDPTEPRHETSSEPAAEPGSDSPSSGQATQSTLQAPPDLEPEPAAADDEEDGALPDAGDDDSGDVVAEGPLALGHAAIENAVRLAPTSPGVYRMLNAANDVLYVGKAKNVKQAVVVLCARPTAACDAHRCA